MSTSVCPSFSVPRTSSTSAAGSATGRPLIIAKIEKDTASTSSASPGERRVMVARGDSASAPLRAGADGARRSSTRPMYGRPVITATNAESMIERRGHARRVSDVANAVFDGTDTVISRARPPSASSVSPSSMVLSPARSSAAAPSRMGRIRHPRSSDTCAPGHADRAPSPPPPWSRAARRARRRD